MHQLRETDVETVFADFSFVTDLDMTDKQSPEHASRPLSRQLETLTR